eukprot:jgi/Tetstr1/437199/TSEL_002769.t1
MGPRPGMAAEVHSVRRPVEGLDVTIAQDPAGGCAAPAYANSMFKRGAEAAHTVTAVGCLGGFFFGSKWMDGRAAKLREQAVLRMQQTARHTGMSAYVRHTHEKMHSQNLLPELVHQKATMAATVETSDALPDTSELGAHSRSSSIRSGSSSASTASTGDERFTLRSRSTCSVPASKITPLYVTAARNPKRVGAKATKLPSSGEDDPNRRPPYVTQKSRRLSLGFRSSTREVKLPPELAANIPRRMSVTSARPPSLDALVPRSQSMVAMRSSVAGVPRAWDEAVGHDALGAGGRARALTPLAGSRPLVGAN